MTGIPDEPTASLKRLIDKGQARRLVAAMLDGSGLSVREQKRELVIINPRDQEKGRVYVEYDTGHVSWQRTVLEHWGPLQGYTDEDNNDGRVGAGQILNALHASTREQVGHPNT
jgi:hypothetical protein